MSGAGISMMKKIGLIILLVLFTLGVGVATAKDDVYMPSWEELGDDSLFRAKNTPLNTRGTYWTTRATAEYLKAILEEEKKQTEILWLIYYKECEK